LDEEKGICKKITILELFVVDNKTSKTLFEIEQCCEFNIYLIIPFISKPIHFF